MLAPYRRVAGRPSELAEAFERHRAELRFHCYQMLGAVADAEDLVQETFIRALAASDKFEGRSALRTWLFRIATHACIDELRRRKRRRLHSDRGPNGAEDEAEGDLDADLWIQPFPDELVPDRRYARAEAVTLAFVAALQRLPARQRAALVLRESLDWSVEEIAALLEMTVAAVNSALQRARATLAVEPGERAGSRSRTGELAAARTFARAFERGDVAALTSMLRRDVEVHMPPFRLWLRGRDAVLDFVGRRIWPGRVLRLATTRANGRIAVTMVDQPRRSKRGRPFAVAVIELDRTRKLRRLYVFVVPRLVAHFRDAAPVTGARRARRRVSAP